MNIHTLCWTNKLCRILQTALHRTARSEKENTQDHWPAQKLRAVKDPLYNFALQKQPKHLRPLLIKHPTVPSQPKTLQINRHLFINSASGSFLLKSIFVQNSFYIRIKCYQLLLVTNLPRKSWRLTPRGNSSCLYDWRLTNTPFIQN